MRKARVDRVHLEDVKYLWEKTAGEGGEGVWGGENSDAAKEGDNEVDAQAPPETPPVNGWVDGAGAKEATVVLN